MNTLPRAKEAVIPIEKFTKYALNPDGDKNKSFAFLVALGYKAENAGQLIDQIRLGLSRSPAVEKGDAGYGMRYQVIMFVKGANGKTAKIKTGWIDDNTTGEVAIISDVLEVGKAYIAEIYRPSNGFGITIDQIWQHDIASVFVETEHPIAGAM